MTPELKNTILGQIADSLGPHAIDNIVSAVHQASNSEGLRFWQERLLERVAEQTSIANLDGLVELFADVGSTRIRVSRDQFLRSPVEYWTNKYFQVNDEWLGDAWRDEDFRELIVRQCVSDLNPVCDWLGHSHLDTLLLLRLSKGLAVEQVRQLYEHIRDEWPPFELRWRSTFAEAFPAAARVLPEPRW